MLRLFLGRVRQLKEHCVIPKHQQPGKMISTLFLTFSLNDIIPANSKVVTKTGYTKMKSFKLLSQLDGENKNSTGIIEQQDM